MTREKLKIKAVICYSNNMYHPKCLWVARFGPWIVNFTFILLSKVNLTVKILGAPVQVWEMSISFRMNSLAKTQRMNFIHSNWRVMSLLQLEWWTSPFTTPCTVSLLKGETWAIIIGVWKHQALWEQDRYIPSQHYVFSDRNACTYAWACAQVLDQPAGVMESFLLHFTVLSLSS